MSRRFRAPTKNGEVLADPPFDAVAAAVVRNRQRLQAADVVLDGTRLAEFRSLARAELLQTSGDALVFVTGHQPELFHPGVWSKNFALNGLAKRLHAIPLNLIVDNDTMKSGHLLKPVWNADPAKVRLIKEPFEEFAGQVPWEFTKWAKEFSERRIATEERWGCTNRELTVSQLSQSKVFRRFAAHITNHLPSFRVAYNRAVADYRQQHGIVNRSHPVPDLEAGELPFWEFVPGKRIRATASTPPERLRPRALTLTIFVRLCLADWFIHGIGGGKYDEVTDGIIREFFGIEPPEFQVVTATVYLPFKTFPSTRRDVELATQRLRRLHWNPEEFLPAEYPARVEKARLTAHKPTDRHEIRAWFARIRGLTDRMRLEVAEEIATTTRDRDRARSEVAANAILRRRDYSWVLYPEETLKPFLQQFLE